MCNNGGSSPIKNGCTSSRENLLAKTDVAMASLLVRLDQVAVQCHAAQSHGGGRFMCEDKFQVSFNRYHPRRHPIITISFKTSPYHF